MTQPITQTNLRVFHLEQRVQSLESLVLRLLTVLHDGGTLEDDEVAELGGTP